jgi:hypothetical protein
VPDSLPPIDAAGARDPLALVPPGTPNADASNPLRQARPLSDALRTVGEERTPGRPEEGSTPLPQAFALLRATMGGASQRELGEYFAPLSGNRPPWAETAVTAALAEGRLSAGLHIVVGHTGGGKTALALNLAGAAVEAEHPVIYVSLELDEAEIAARAVAIEAGVPWVALNLGRPLHDDQRLSVHHAKTKLAPRLARFYTWAPDPQPGEARPTVRGLRDMVYAVWQRHRHRTPLVVFDYLQFPGIFGESAEAEKFLPIRERIGAIVMQLRHLSKRHPVPGTDREWPGCPVLVLSTTARSNTKADGGVQGMDGTDPDDLRFAPLEALKALPKEAGEVEATAVTMWALAQESYNAEERTEGGTHERTRRLTLRLAKNRRGTPGQWLPLRFDGATGRFTDDPTRYSAAQRSSAAAPTNGKRNARATTPREID